MARKAILNFDQIYLLRAFSAQLRPELYFALILNLVLSYLLKTRL